MHLKNLHTKCKGNSKATFQLQVIYQIHTRDRICVNCRMEIEYMLEIRYGDIICGRDKIGRMSGATKEI